MPDSNAFLYGFGFIKGSKFDGYILSSAISTHETISRYHEYRYFITLTFNNLGNGIYDNLFSLVRSTISQQHIIYGIRNPYRCIIDAMVDGDITSDNNGTITFYLLGHSYRI